MLSIIIGGSASGKSEYAERLIERLDGRRIYVATMQPWDEECRQRIAKHRRQRSHRNFETMERYLDLAGLDVPEDGNVLLEDLSNLLANETWSPGGNGAQAVIDGVLALSSKCRHLTIVTNDVFSGGRDYSEETLDYLKCFALVNRSIAAKADFAAELVFGIPNILKGEYPN